VSRTHPLCISFDFASPHRRKIKWTPHEKSASFVRVKFTMSLRLPSGRRSRNMAGHLASGTMRGSSLGGLRLSVTRFDFWSLDRPGVGVTLRTASTATPGRVIATLMGAPRSRARCVAFRQRELQKRAVERCGLKCEPQARQVALMPKAHRARASPGAKPRGRALVGRAGSS
jgi:hypothetical protein